MVERHAFVLVHSPIAGPVTWEPVAAVLRDRGIAVTVPTLVDDGSPPFWRQHARCVVRGIAEEIEPGRPLVLVAHSAAGQLLGVLGPVLRDAGYRVAGEILADAGLPPAGRSRLEQLDDESPELADHVRALLDDGVGFPDWSDHDLGPLVPDDELRRTLLGQLRPPPPAYWVEDIPTAVDWPDAPVGALIFSTAYHATARAAQAQDWPLRVLDGDNHLLALADAARVAEELLALSNTLVGDGDGASASDVLEVTGGEVQSDGTSDGDARSADARDRDGDGGGDDDVDVPNVGDGDVLSAGDGEQERQRDPGDDDGHLPGVGDGLG